MVMVLWSKQKKGEKDMRNLVFSLIGNVQNIHEESLIGFSHILEEPFSFRKSSHSIDGHSKLQKLKGLQQYTYFSYFQALQFCCQGAFPPFFLLLMLLFFVLISLVCKPTLLYTNTYFYVARIPRNPFVLQY